MKQEFQCGETLVPTHRNKSFTALKQILNYVNPEVHHAITFYNLQMKKIFLVKNVRHKSKYLLFFL